MGDRFIDRWRAAAVVPSRFDPVVPFLPATGAAFAGPATNRAALAASSSHRLGLSRIHAETRGIEQRQGTQESPKGELAGRTPASLPAAAEITALYVDFPDVVQRWDVEEVLTAGLVADKHAHIDAVIAAHGGRHYPGLLDARYALFESVDAAVAAALAIARGADGPGPLAVSMGLASGPVSTDEYGHLRIVNQARALAHLAGPCGIVLAESTVGRLAGGVPDDARLSPMGVRRLPELNSLDHPSRLFLFGQPAASRPRRVARFVDRIRRR